MLRSRSLTNGRTPHRTDRIAALVLVAFSAGQPPVRSEINRLYLGSQFDASGSQSTFRVYSSRATRIEIDLYSSPTGADEAAHLVRDRDPATSVWSTRLPVARLRGEFGIAGTIYCGFRAWGPNWPFNATWTKGSKVSFITDVDENGNRFNPQKILFDACAREPSHDPITPAQRDGSIYASGAGK